MAQIGAWLALGVVVNRRKSAMTALVRRAHISVIGHGVLETLLILIGYTACGNHATHGHSNEALVEVSTVTVPRRAGVKTADSVTSNRLRLILTP